MPLRFARRPSVAVASLLVAVSLAVASCDTVKPATGVQSADKTVKAPPPPPTPTLPKFTLPELQPPPPAEPPVPQQTAPAREGPTRAALLLPLSGRLSTLGKAMAEAAEVALFDLADRRFELLPYDDKGTPEGSAEAAKAAVGDGAQIILGPVLAASVRAVAPVAAAANIPVVAFSSDRKVAGGGVFIMGFTPEAEVDRVVSFSIGRGLSRFAALVPDNPYGSAVSDALYRATAGTPARVVKLETYDAKTQDFAPVVRRLTGAPEPGTAADAAPALPTIPGFDALLLAEGGQQLRAMAAALAQAGIRGPGVQLLGTGKWDEPGLGTEPALVGAWFAAPVPIFRDEFEVHYKRTFGKAPPRLATLAYDATALAAVLARGAEADPFTVGGLTNPNGFIGRDGLFRFAPDGIAERRLAILRVDRNGTTVVEEAPRSFAAGS